MWQLLVNLFAAEVFFYFRKTFCDIYFLVQGMLISCLRELMVLNSFLCSYESNKQNGFLDIKIHNISYSKVKKKVKRKVSNSRLDYCCFRWKWVYKKYFSPKNSQHHIYSAQYYNNCSRGQPVDIYLETDHYSVVFRYFLTENNDNIPK